jgi:HlyD family type I secretion membrane fusion protein
MTLPIPHRDAHLTVPIGNGEHAVFASTTPAAHPPRKRGLGLLLAAGISLLAFGAGGVGVFAAYVPVDAAVVAPGTIAFETNRKRVQHPEGGIIRDIAVREGQRVREGDILFRLEPLQAEVNLTILQNQIAVAEAQIARLEAEIAGKSELVLPYNVRASAAGRAAALEEQAQLEQRQASLRGQTGIAESRVRQTMDQINGAARERDAVQQQQRLIETELVGVRKLFELNLVARPRLSALERDQARLTGALGQLDAAISRLRGVADEGRREIAQLQQAARERASGEMRAARDRLNEARERGRSASAALARVEIRAPQSGVVQSLAVSTLGEVVQPAALLLEIAAEDEPLVIDARIAPRDIDGVIAGMNASVRLIALPGRLTPLTNGVVRSVSRDRIIDPSTREAHFLARVALKSETLPANVLPRLTAGMPVDVILPTEQRNLLDYMVRPLSDALARGLRER